MQNKMQKICTNMHEYAQMSKTSKDRSGLKNIQKYSKHMQTYANICKPMQSRLLYAKYPITEVWYTLNNTYQHSRWGRVWQAACDSVSNLARSLIAAVQSIDFQVPGCCPAIRATTSMNSSEDCVQRKGQATGRLGHRASVIIASVIIMKVQFKSKLGLDSEVVDLANW